MFMLEKLRPWLRERIGLFPLAEPAPSTLSDTDTAAVHPETEPRGEQEDPAAAASSIRRNWLYRAGPWQMK